MRSSEPPNVATWVLTLLGNEPFTGDLVEEYRRGRSAAWYWRQVLIAVIIGCGKQIGRHKLLALRAVLTGWAAWMLSWYLIALPLYRLYSSTVRTLGLGPMQFWWRHYYSYPLVLVPCVGGFLSGWLVARFHRSHRVAMVFLYALSVLLTSLPEFFRLASNSLSNTRFVPYLALYLSVSLGVVSILFGGLRSPNHESARSVQ
jgi:hypothetical protein